MLWTWGSDDYGRLGHGMKMDILGSKVARPTMVAYFAGEEGTGREDPLRSGLNGDPEPHTPYGLGGLTPQLTPNAFPFSQRGDCSTLQAVKQGLDRLGK